MIQTTICFALGVAASLLLSSLPSTVLLILLACSCALALCIGRLRLLCIILLGFIWAVLQAQSMLSERLPAQLEGQSINVTGIIVSLPERRGDLLRFLLDIETVTGKAAQLWPSPGKVRLSWYDQYISLRPGERWNLQIKLRRPHGLMNPGGFDYETWLFTRRISATGYVRSSFNNEKQSDTYRFLFNRLRFNIGNNINKLIDNEYTGLIRALVIGDRSMISKEQWLLLKKTGTNHLLAISGLHIGLVAAIAFFFGYRLWSLNTYLTTRLPARYFAAAFAVLIAIIYAGLAGFSLPTQRAIIMLSVFMSGILCNRQWRISWVIATAFLLILIIYPFSLLAVDFWLSFSAVIIIAYITANRTGADNKIKALAYIQLLIPLGLAPLLLLWFQQLALYSFFANMVAVPVTTLVIVPTILFASSIMPLMPALAAAFFQLGSFFLGLLFSFLDFLHMLPLASWGHPRPSMLALVFAIVGLLILLMPRGLAGRWLALCWLLPLLYPRHDTPQQGTYHLHLLDVGQGLAAVIKTQKHVLLYDAGPGGQGHFDTGSNVIVPFLTSQGITQVDTLLLSHGDSDHIGGADSILKEIDVDMLITNTDKVVHQRKQACLAGHSWHWDGVLFSILHPIQASAVSGNNQSCVLKVSSANMSILLPGDIEDEVELQLAKKWGDMLAADILLAPHHGSRTSSSTLFIQQVSPQLVLFPVGYQNRFGFPKPDIIERYYDAGSKIYTSTNSGTISVRSNKNQITLEEYRRKKRRFWHAE